MILVVALILLVLAWLFNLGMLVYGFYILLAVFFISHVFTAGWISSITASRQVSATVAAIGDAVSVVVKLNNAGKLPVSWVMVEDMLPDTRGDENRMRLDVTGTHVDVTDFPAGKHQLIYQVHCLRRGYYQIGPLVAETGDLFGLNRRYRVLLQPDYLLVNPEVVELEGYDLASRRPIGEIVMTHKLYEDPTRVAGIRSYQPGDSLSRIHWRATARTGTLQSKVYESSWVAGSSILVDFHKDSLADFVRAELSVSCAASIANAVHQMRQQTGLFSNGRDAADRIREEGWQGDRRTRREARESAVMMEESDRLRPVVVPTRLVDHQFQDILQVLARLELTDGLKFAAFVNQIRERLPRDATVIAILARLDLESGSMLGQLRRQGYAVSAIINCHENEDFARMSGPLVAQGIETRHLKDQDSIRVICQRQVLGGLA
jgi:uncharacterized repeat protein (TIGR01451 family)